jgi:hypothetical protein
MRKANLKTVPAQDIPLDRQEALERLLVDVQSLMAAVPGLPWLPETPSAALSDPEQIEAQFDNMPV